MQTTLHNCLAVGGHAISSVFWRRASSSLDSPIGEEGITKRIATSPSAVGRCREFHDADASILVKALPMGRYFRASRSQTR